MKHLNEQKLTEEQFTYLNSVPIKSDSLYLHYFYYYLKNNNHEKITEIGSSKNELILNDAQLMRKASVMMLTSNKKLKKQWFENINLKDSLFNEIKQVYLASEFPKNATGSLIYESSEFKKYKKFESKKPALGAIYSMLVPGLGKWYAGSPKAFLTTFLLNTSYGLSSYESIHKLGIRNGFSIATVSIAGLFYVANIYGGYKAIKDAKRSHKHQFLIHAQNYYNFNYSIY